MLLGRGTTLREGVALWQDCVRRHDRRLVQFKYIVAPLSRLEPSDEANRLSSEAFTHFFPQLSRNESSLQNYRRFAPLYYERRPVDGERGLSRRLHVTLLRNGPVHECVECRLQPIARLTRQGFACTRCMAARAQKRAAAR
jgi:hypothetical protein